MTPGAVLHSLGHTGNPATALSPSRKPAPRGPGRLVALERKIRSAGQPWTMGAVAMVADGQWAVPTKSRADRSQDDVAQARLRDGQRVELTVEGLARAVGAADPGADCERAQD
ncbi:hypothetical protein ACW14Y_04990 [Kitasatospora sp. cg17-2]